MGLRDPRLGRPALGMPACEYKGLLKVDPAWAESQSPSNAKLATTLR